MEDNTVPLSEFYQTFDDSPFFFVSSENEIVPLLSLQGISHEVAESEGEDGKPQNASLTALCCHVGTSDAPVTYRLTGDDIPAFLNCVRQLRQV